MPDQLIIGRSDEKNSERRNGYLRSLISESGIEILSYDSVISYYSNGSIFNKDVMKYKNGLFEYKYLNTMPENIFSFVGPSGLRLSPNQKEVLKKEGYEIDKWGKGEFLTFNTKYTESGFYELGKKIVLSKPNKHNS